MKHSARRPTNFEHRTEFRCPDCDSVVRLRPAPTGVLRVRVEHDPTCPAYLAHGNAPYSMLVQLPTHNEKHAEEG